MTKPLSVSVARRLSRAAQHLNTVAPSTLLKPLLEKAGQCALILDQQYSRVRSHASFWLPDCARRTGR